MVHVEIEVKISIREIQPLIKKLQELHFVQLEKEFFETNIIFDTPENKLREKGLLLRLRKKNGSSVLTFKRPSSAEIPGSYYKIREEIETGVSDFESVKAILLALGYDLYFVYEKYREIYQKKNVLITVDRTPIGNFIEIEGNGDEIDAISEKLGFGKKDYIVENYYSLFRKIFKTGWMTF